MYGTTMKNYGVNRASGTKDVRKVASNHKETPVKNKKAKKIEEKDTRYVKVKSSKSKVQVIDEPNEQEVGFSRKDFPIPSVIVTVLLTMMALFTTVGLLGM